MKSSPDLLNPWTKRVKDNSRGCKMNVVSVMSNRWFRVDSIGKVTSRSIFSGKGKGIAEEEKVKSEFDFEAYKLRKVNAVNQALDVAIPIGDPLKVREAMRYSLLSEGKRVRPLVCIAACELVGGSEATAMPAACSLEMINALSLMQDDLPCIDNDNFRRGKLATHKVFGENVTILASSALLACAFEHIAKSTVGISPDRVLHVISEIARLTGREGVFSGQVVDLDPECGAKVGLELVEFIHLRKSSSLLEASAVAGAILGGASDVEIDKLREYSRLAGLMYQVVDDILDITQTSEELGKTAGKDLIADKLTYPKLIGIEKSRAYVEELKKEAQYQLAGFDPEKSAPLISMANFMAVRQR